MFTPKTKVEFPFPALVAADLHVVVSRVLCSVTCAPCWAALCPGSRTPRCPSRARSGRTFPARPGGCARLRGDYLLHPALALFQEVELPVGLLDPHVGLAQLPGQVVGLRTQVRDRQRGDHLQF